MDIKTAMENIIYGEKHRAANDEPLNLLTYLESKGFCDAYDSQQKKIDALIEAIQSILVAIKALETIEGKD